MLQERPSFLSGTAADHPLVALSALTPTTWCCAYVSTELHAKQNKCFSLCALLWPDLPLHVGVQSEISNNYETYLKSKGVGWSREKRGGANAR